MITANGAAGLVIIRIIVALLNRLRSGRPTAAATVADDGGPSMRQDGGWLGTVQSQR